MNNKLFDLSGKTAMVTGASRGLGKAIARTFAEAGADVVAVSRHEADLRKATAEISDGLKTRVEWIAADLSNRPDTARLAEMALSRFGVIDILVNNAGSNIPEAIDEVSDEKWDHIVELNLSSCMALTRALAPSMKERKWGRIIYISSVLGLSGKETRAGYCTTKSALLGLTRASALDLGAYNITVNCIAPGPFLTDLPARILSDEQKRDFEERTALKRWGRPEELGGPALLLASEAGSYITGGVLLVDGGVLCTTF